MTRAPRARDDVALAATLHDPSGALAADIRRALPALRNVYSHVAVTTSPPTSARAITALAEGGAHAGTPPSNTRGPLYRLALRRALASGAAYVHYLDFDRVLHARGRLGELAAVLRQARRSRALLVGRTVAAHRSHHRPLWTTEEEANRLLAGRLGFSGRVDFLVPSFVLDRVAARRLLVRSRARDSAIYGELAALLAGLAPALAYVEWDALDWETPDRDRRGVGRVGLARWRERMDTPAEWELRRELAAAIATGFACTLARHPARGVRLVRYRRPAIAVSAAGAGR